MHHRSQRAKAPSPFLPVGSQCGGDGGGRGTGGGDGAIATAPPHGLHALHLHIEQWPWCDLSALQKGMHCCVLLSAALLFMHGAPNSLRATPASAASARSARGAMPVSTMVLLGYSSTMVREVPW